MKPLPKQETLYEELYKNETSVSLSTEKMIDRV